MINRFGQMPDGRDVLVISLRGQGISARILTLGAILQDLRLEGVDWPLTLGAPALGPYLGPMAYFGAVVGRYANRIAGGQFSLGGTRYTLPRNDLGRNCLHGGPDGAAQQLWAVTDHAEDRLSLSLHLPDGHMGFPGALDIALIITLGRRDITFDITARSDRPTPCSLAHHGFYALDQTGGITEHELRIAADAYLPVDSAKIPLGQIASVAGTTFDFRVPRRVGSDPLDHNFCLSAARSALRPVAWLRSPVSGLGLTLATTEPGLQVFTAGHLPKAGVISHDGRAYPRFAGIALEPQGWPDAPNQPGFPDTILHPGQGYHQQTRLTLHRPSR